MHCTLEISTLPTQGSSARDGTPKPHMVIHIPEMDSLKRGSIIIIVEILLLTVVVMDHGVLRQTEIDDGTFVIYQPVVSLGSLFSVNGNNLMLAGVDGGGRFVLQFERNLL